MIKGALLDALSSQSELAQYRGGDINLFADNYLKELKGFRV